MLIPYWIAEKVSGGLINAFLAEVSKICTDKSAYGSITSRLVDDIGTNADLLSDTNKYGSGLNRAKGRLYIIEQLFQLHKLVHPFTGDIMNIGTVEDPVWSIDIFLLRRFNDPYGEHTE